MKVIKFNYNWPDEFDIESYSLMSDKKAHLVHDILNHPDFTIDSDREYYFGTNEWVTIESKEEFLKGLSFKLVPEAVGKWMIMQIGSEFGLLSNITDMVIENFKPSVNVDQELIKLIEEYYECDQF